MPLRLSWALVDPPGCLFALHDVFHCLNHFIFFSVHLRGVHQAAGPGLVEILFVLLEPLWLSRDAARNSFTHLRIPWHSSLICHHSQAIEVKIDCYLDSRENRIRIQFGRKGPTLWKSQIAGSNSLMLLHFAFTYLTFVDEIFLYYTLYSGKNNGRGHGKQNTE